MTFPVDTDRELLKKLALVQTACLTASGAIMSVALLAWFVPSLASALPSFWKLTSANTALAGLVATLALAFSPHRHSPWAHLLSHVLAALVGCVAVFVVAAYLSHTSFHLELLLPYAHNAPALGRMAVQTATCFALLSVVTLLLTQRSNLLAVIADIAVAVLATDVLFDVACSSFGAMHLYAVPGPCLAPCTAVCLLFLTFVALGRRAEYGIFAIVLGRGTGSHIARMAIPLAILFPFALEIVRGIVVHNSPVSQEYAAATGTTFSVLFASALIFVLTWQMLHLEKELLDLSLRDDLTDLYNRRGFFLLAEQALWLARRNRVPFFVLYIDLDDLKTINDTQGHDMGSAFIREAGAFLKQVVRKSDVVGRIGGDEFVVAGQSEQEDVPSIIMERLIAVAEERNTSVHHRYRFSLSVGCVSSSGSESLQDLLHQADCAMYASKNSKKASRASNEQDIK